MGAGHAEGDSPRLPEVRPVRPEGDPEVQAATRAWRAVRMRRWQRRARKSAPFLLLLVAWHVLVSATQRDSVRAAVLADLIDTRRDYYVAVEGGRDPSPAVLARLRAPGGRFHVAAASEAPPRDEHGLIPERTQNGHAISIGVDDIDLVLPFLAIADVYAVQAPLAGAGYRTVVVWMGRRRVVCQVWTWMS